MNTTQQATSTDPHAQAIPMPRLSDDAVIQIHDFIQAIKVLPTNFTEEEKNLIIRRASYKLHGKLRSLFQVISDDMVKKSKPGQSKPGQSRGSKRPPSPSTGNTEKQRK